jgi:ribosomal-protein-serine acetyltransferase
MFSHRVNDQTELRLIDRAHAPELFALMGTNREHLQRWHPWIAQILSVTDVERLIARWQQQYVLTQAVNAGIWHRGKFCGMVGHLNVDWTNRTAILTYWLDAAHQGRGIMTECCRALITHAFETWKLNRLTIECATANTRSRAIPERLGFTLEGTAREVEWLHDHFADHAIYGLLKSDHARNLLRESLGNFGVAGQYSWKAETSLARDFELAGVGR